MPTTLADQLAELAPTAIRAGREDFPTDPGRARIAAAKYLRTACTPDGGPQPDLRDAVAAVDAALARQTTMDTIAPHARQSGTGWIYQFPNGRSASVYTDAQPLRFEVASTDGEHMTGLSTVEVEALLIDIATRTR